MVKDLPAMCRPWVGEGMNYPGSFASPIWMHLYFLPSLGNWSCLSSVAERPRTLVNKARPEGQWSNRPQILPCHQLVDPIQQLVPACANGEMATPAPWLCSQDEISLFVGR